MKQLYKAEFTAALREAVAGLARRERELLRHSLVEGTSIDQLAVRYGAHRATLARWIAAARETLFGTFRTSLMSKLSIDKTEFETLLRLIQSRFDLSVEKLFTSAA
jgi:RNA polymerase sigma-70 factor (ECF subfamily)